MAFPQAPPGFVYGIPATIFGFEELQIGIHDLIGRQTWRFTKPRCTLNTKGELYISAIIFPLQTSYIYIFMLKTVFGDLLIQIPDCWVRWLSTLEKALRMPGNGRTPSYLWLTHLPPPYLRHPRHQ